MRYRYIVFLISIIGFCSSYAQNEEETLLTVNDKPIEVSEFLRVYNKNLDLVKDASQRDIDGYLDLFIKYQLKLAEAKALKLDEEAKYKREFDSYKRQLTQNYLSESKVTEALIKEAHERMKYDIKASHILVTLDENSKDTLAVYNQLLDLRERVLTEGYDKVKQDVHNGSSIFAEDLGYFSAFKMVYDFESMAYNTQVGEVSMPFRTPYGYHIVKIHDKRASKGTATAAHIMIALEQKDSTVNPEVRINEIYKKLEQGESFDALAKQFSDDKSSARKGGELSPFKSGQLSSEVFENKTFQLQNNGDYTAPFKTKFGWHIVKLIDKKPLPDLEEMRPELENRVKRDARSKLINSAMVEELKKRYDISINEDYKPYFKNILNETYFKRTWRAPENLESDLTIFTINDQKYDHADFAKHLQAAQGAYMGKSMAFNIIIDKEFNSFFERTILKYREENLENENEEFANILKEYRDGLLLFDLMEKEIWNKAAKDSVGLQAYYQANIVKYQWPRRIEGVVANTASEKDAKKVLKLLKKGHSQESISSELNDNDQQNVIFTSGVFNIEDERLPNDLVIEEGVSKIYFHNEAYQVIKIKEILEAGIKTFEEAKGNVINDYQNEIELQWIASLREKYPVNINESVLQAIKSNTN
ncbi:MAG: peptidylprolyl isomerase [Winogradskyella sp.]|uniref:peptidylprolyl isomerase n=1 Tax=Winogradskyella sp. TaxID=1883156 RepID=UPI001803FA81|nr:peptidylprolyl isomerase [Winogradskyella sp.]